MITTINDAIPANADRLELKMSATPLAFDLYTGTSALSQVLYSRQAVGDSLVNVSNFTFSAFLLQNTTPFTATLTCYDANNNVIAQKVINNVSIAPNQKTYLTGNLFGGSGTGSISGGFVAAVDTTWSPTVKNINF